MERGGVRRGGCEDEARVNRTARGVAARWKKLS